MKKINVILLSIVFFVCGCTNSNNDRITTSDISKETEQETTTINILTFNRIQLSVSPETAEEDFVYHFNEDGEVVIDDYTGKSNIIHIPLRIEGKMVKEIERLSCNKEVIGVLIESNVSRIAEEAFSGWESLKCVSFDGSYTEFEKFVIGDHAFKNCSNLEEIYIDASELGKGVFLNCTALKEVYIENDRLKILDGTFKNCTNLKTVYLPERLKEIKGGCFEGCTSLKYIEIPKYVKYIDGLPNGITVCSERGTYGEKYAKEKGIKYEKLRLSEEILGDMD